MPTYQVGLVLEGIVKGCDPVLVSKHQNISLLSETRRLVSRGSGREGERERGREREGERERERERGGGGDFITTSSERNLME